MDTVGTPPDDVRGPLPEVRPEPPTAQDISPQLDFLYRASENLERSVQFADAKVGGVVLILGIGILDLFRHIGDFLDSRDQSAAWGWLATVSACLSITFGVLTLLQIGRTLFPRTRPGLGSLFFFGAVASFPSPREYGDKVWFSRERDLVSSMATQAWNLAGIASSKYRHLRLAYTAALAFACFWALARLGLSLAH